MAETNSWYQKILNLIAKRGKKKEGVRIAVYGDRLSMSTKVLLTSFQMSDHFERYQSKFEELGMQVTIPNTVASKVAISQEQLLSLLPDHDGWIIGDDKVDKTVLAAGSSGRLRAGVRWGIGVDNVDFDAAEKFGVKIGNTPGVFGEEIADLAIHYLTGLARQTHVIDRGVRAGDWPKFTGVSLKGKKVALVGYGDIGRNFAIRARAAGLENIVYDPGFINAADVAPDQLERWPERLSDCDFIVLTCALTKSNYHMIDSQTLSRTKKGAMLVNVARGGLVDEEALYQALSSGQIFAAALEVFETEPPEPTSPLLQNPRCIFGTHSASNTVEANDRASFRAIRALSNLLTDPANPPAKS